MSWGHSVRDYRKEAWVVRCKGCSCTITTKAICSDADEAAPTKAAEVLCACCNRPFHYYAADIFRARPGPGLECERYKRVPEEKNGANNKEANGALVVAATLTAAMLLRDELKAHQIRPVLRLSARSTPLSDWLRW